MSFSSDYYEKNREAIRKMQKEYRKAHGQEIKQKKRAKYIQRITQLEEVMNKNSSDPESLFYVNDQDRPPD